MFLKKASGNISVVSIKAVIKQALIIIMGNIYIPIY